jgi:GDPmannose 4,6-dehydratase
LGKTVLITGITGQDSSYLAELLLQKNYRVIGLQRRSSTITTSRIDRLLESGDIETYYGDLADANSIVRLLMKYKPDEVYSVGSQSHVRISFDVPVYTAQITGISPLMILEALRTLDMKNVKILQCSSSEMYGISTPPQNESTPFQPQSPYGASKLFAYWMVRAYRVGYGMFACNSICFNHESERRSVNFVTQKICHEAAKIKLGVVKDIRLGNLDAKRDWGHSSDYVKCMYLIMQHKEPDDFVISTQEQYSVREFAEKVFRKLGMDFYDYVKFDEQYLRPNEVPSLLGDSTKARTVLGWKPEINFEQLVDMMVTKAMEEEEFNLYKSRKHQELVND